MQAPFDFTLEMTEKAVQTSILKCSPFDLEDEDIEWVMATVGKLNIREKIGQLINAQIFPEDASLNEEINNNSIGSVSLINFADKYAAKKVVDNVVRNSKVPPLVCADLEGGVTSGHMTSSFPNQLGVAAANCPQTYGKALELLSKELMAIGVNWTFSPVLDVNKSIHSAIVGTRSYGSNPKIISEFANLHIEIFQSNGIATTAKHWPGEGYDDRDQHLVTTINPLSINEWNEVFGKLYAQAINAGVMSIMSAHIAFPDYARQKGESGIELYRPASISKHLNHSLLRGELNFNGLIVSDATLMGGLESWGARKSWLPEIIENGCDMILFSSSITEDIETLVAAVDGGILSMRRIDEALMRVLGLKAKLKLHRQSKCGQDISISAESSCPEDVFASLATLSITLVKDTKSILPLNKTTIKKVLIFKEENINPLGGGEGFNIFLDKLLIQEGFEVKVFDSRIDQIEDYINFDLIIYALAQESQLTKSRLYLDWSAIHGGTLAGMRRLWWDKPSLLISFGHPYYLYDAPRMPCLINAYTPIPAAQRAVVEKLMGRSEFLGKSPVDAFCGLEDAYF